MTKGKTSDNIMLKNIDQKKLSAETQVTEAIKHLVTGNITQTKKVIQVLPISLRKYKRGKKVKNLCDKYGLKRKGLVTIIELNLRLLAKGVKIKSYGDRITQYKLKQMFAMEQK